jgi:hypothetical protein
MIYLTKGQALFDNPGMVVCDQTGYYEDASSVICAVAYAPEEPVCRYEAKFIAYGNLVYSITDPEKLMEEVIKIDPKSLFNKSSQDVAVDKVVNNIQTVESSDVDETAKTPIINPEQVDDALASTTSPVVVDNTFPTTTPVTTEPQKSIVPEVSTKIEEIVPVVESVIEDLTKVSEIVESVSTTSPTLNEITF